MALMSGAERGQSVYSAWRTTSLLMLIQACDAETRFTLQIIIMNNSLTR